MTTKTEPRLPLTSLEWRLYIVAALASVYVISWRLIDRPAAAALPAATERPAPAPPIAATAPAVVRPVVRPVARPGARASPPTPAVRIQRVPIKRRVRTRSS